MKKKVRLVILFCLLIFNHLKSQTTPKTVKIGEQTWMAENLAVTTFKNGDPIPRAKSFEEWKNANDNGEPMFCYYKNDPSTAIKYGVLYNFWAINDSRGIAPEGWRIPSHTDIKQLDEFLNSDLISMENQFIQLKEDGYSTDNLGKQILAKYRENLAVKKLKSTTGWSTPKDISDKNYYNGTNSLGFNAKPSATRGDYYSGSEGFYLLKDARFWTTSFYDKEEGKSPVCFKIDYQNNYWLPERRYTEDEGSESIYVRTHRIGFEEEYFGSGLPVRCIK